MYINALDAVSVSCFTTPDSLNRLPSISIPTRGAVVGRIIHTTMVINDREEDLLKLGYRTKLIHLDLTLFFCCKQLHDRRLDDRHQGHIGICCYSDRSHQCGLSQLTCKENRCRTICTADDGDSCCCLSIEAK